MPHDFLAPINLFTTRILRLQPLRSKEDVVIVNARAERACIWIIIPFLNEQHAGLRARVRLESVPFESDNGEDAATLRDELAHALVARIVKASLRQDDRHAPAGF